MAGIITCLVSFVVVSPTIARLSLQCISSLFYRVNILYQPLSSCSHIMAPTVVANITILFVYIQIDIREL